MDIESRQDVKMSGDDDLTIKQTHANAGMLICTRTSVIFFELYLLCCLCLFDDGFNGCLSVTIQFDCLEKQG